MSAFLKRIGFDPLVLSLSAAIFRTWPTPLWVPGTKPVAGRNRRMGF